MDELKTLVVAGACNFPDGTGGAPRCMHMLAKGFQDIGMHVDVVTTFGSAGAKGSLPFGFTCFGVLESRSVGSTSWERIRTHVLFLLALAARTIKGRYDYTLFYGPVASFVLVSALCRLFGRKSMYFRGDIEPRTPNQSLKERWKRRSVNLVDVFLARMSGLVVIIGTKKLLDRYRRFAPRTPKLQILAPVDTALFASGNGDAFRRRHGLEDRMLVAYSGTLDTIEGIQVLLTAFGKVASESADATLVLAGSSDHIDRVVGRKLDFPALAREAGLEGRCLFTGHVSLSEVIDLLNAADILVMPKIRHPMNDVASPIKIGEYLAAGRPVVMSVICELEEHLVDRENAMFVEPGNVEALADALLEIINDGALQRRLAENGRQAALRLFDYRSIAGQIMERYSQVSRRGPWPLRTGGE